MSVASMPRVRPSIRSNRPVSSGMTPGMRAPVRVSWVTDRMPGATFWEHHTGQSARTGRFVIGSSPLANVQIPGLRDVEIRPGQIAMIQAGRVTVDRGVRGEIQVIIFSTPADVVRIETRRGAPKVELTSDAQGNLRKTG